MAAELPRLEDASKEDLELAVSVVGHLAMYGGFLRAVLGGIYAERERHPQPGENLAREAVEALVSIGCWGLDPSKQEDAWVLGARAIRELDRAPMSDDEVAAFREAARRMHA